MIILGIALIVLGLLFHLGLLVTLGIIAVIAGIFLWVVGSSHPVGGRRHWW